VTGGRVLVVDDTSFNRRLLVRLLTSIGHETVEAEDGRQALDLLQSPDSPAVDVILLDIVMPVMDGYETLAVLKSDPALRDLPVIVISGVDELASVVRCIRMGARPGTRDARTADAPPRDHRPAALRAVALPLAAGRRPGLQRRR